MDDQDEMEHRYELWQRGYWEIPKELDTSHFNFDWRPNPYEIPYIHVFGTQWQPSGGPRFVIPESLGYKFQNSQVAKKLPNKSNWIIPDSFNGQFDYSWHHDKFVEPYNYKWKCGVEYAHPDADHTIYLTEYDNINIPTYGKFFTDDIDHLVENQENNFWILNPYCNYSRFNFIWKPKTIAELRYVNVFGNQHSQDLGTKFINVEMYKRGYKDINYVNNVNFFLDTKLDMFYIDHSNSTSEINFNHLKSRYPKITKVRFFDNWVDTITRCVRKATTHLIWIVNSYYDYTNFQFDYYPAPWDMINTHVFGTQWNAWGKTFLINCNQWDLVKNVQEVENVQPIKLIDKKAEIKDCKYDKLLIDFGNQHNLDATYTVPYQGSFLSTIDYWLKKEKYVTSKKNYKVWIVSSICDYDKFDFTYEPLPFDEKQLHVFATQFDNQKIQYGDTFLLDVNEFVIVRSLFEKLEDYTSNLKFVDTLKVKRMQHPVILHNYDCHIDAINLPTEPFPYIQLQNNQVKHLEPINMWEFPTIKTNNDSTSVYVPTHALSYMTKDLYDYEHVVKPVQFYGGEPLDIVYISNGEPKAEQHYEHLQEIVTKKGAKNRIIRIQDVVGRVAAYHAAANISTTRWFFAVFAKLRVNPTFDWGWQPDRLKTPRHYIFTAINPVNRLNYGHQAIIAYNKKLVLGNNGIGLDFTMDNDHEVVNMNSGIAMYNTDSWTTWRTAFREAIKLRDLVDKGIDNDAAYRLERWCSVGIGEYAADSQRGAVDGIAYWEEVNGDFDKLKLSYDWAWLRKRFDSI